MTRSFTSAQTHTLTNLHNSQSTEIPHSYNPKIGFRPRTAVPRSAPLHIRAHSASTSSTSKLSSAWRHTSSATSQTSASKGKLSLTQMQADHEDRMDALSDSATEQDIQIALLKNEHKTENVRDRVEAEKINQRMRESKRIDTELLQAEAKVIALKVQLAQLNARLGGLDPSVSPGALVPHTTLSSSSGFSADQLSAVFDDGRRTRDSESVISWVQ
ncbi:hypothetical protein JVT61DRAFT_7637 [Boletus reticuloceps]|uniref:Uncharacterized protein n=1 Tax=Boletus reticuloceps TaxID=495285 RepID=A0A8I2YI24_9AGAM|nr:hypothetical protein JVT61DRAFT_7637 [Boletus reticuloceps]